MYWYLENNGIKSYMHVSFAGEGCLKFRASL
jgi:hypothetical protein